MHRYIVIFIIGLLVLPMSSAGQVRAGYSRLSQDSAMLSAGIEIVFKGGTLYKLNSRGLVEEGTPARDIDLWTPGPMILFSQAGPVKLNDEGRAYFGTLGANTLIQCVDNEFREFARGNRVQFNEDGLLISGTPVGSISFVLQDQEFMSQPGTAVKFYPNGRIQYVHPQSNMRILTSSGSRLVISSESWVELSETGKFLRGKLQRRYVERHADGSVTEHKAGETIRMDSDGNIIQ